MAEPVKYVVARVTAGNKEEFLAEDNEWTDDKSGAKSFTDIDEAWRVAKPSGAEVRGDR